MKLDELLTIGRDLIDAGVVTSKPDDLDEDAPARPESDVVHRVERRIASMAVEAALAEDDLDAAYRFVLQRLPVDPAVMDPPEDASTMPDHGDDISWRAAFQAGRYRPRASHPRFAARSSTTPQPSKIRGLEMRLELLAHTLLLAPSAALPGVLSAWRQCEGELHNVQAQESDDEDRWDDQVDRKMSGRFIHSSAEDDHVAAAPTAGDVEEDGPMGLFEVARGAAAALSKSAFPLRDAAARPRGLIVGSPSSDRSSEHHLPQGSGEGDEGRSRKRDQISNLVTGGLASGLGWVLGRPCDAPPHGFMRSDDPTAID